MKKRWMALSVFVLSMFPLHAQESESHLPRILRLVCSSGEGLTSLDVSGCSSLTELNVSKQNSLTSLDVSGCSSLKELSVSEQNSLTSLDVSGCTALTRLFCYSNSLTSLDVSGCASLKDLSCGFNALTSLDVSGCTVLEELWCNNNQLINLDVSGCTSLTKLYCGNNQLTNLDVSSCTAVAELYCSNNQLASLDVSGLSALTILGCHRNQLTNLDVSSLSSLTELYCYNNQLTDLDVSSLSPLSTLFCEGNHIPLSILYGIYKQRETWTSSAWNQSDTITLYRCLPWDLSSERMLGETETDFTLKDVSGNDVSAGDYTQNDFVFQFTPPFKGTLTLQNRDFKSAKFTYYISVKECYSVGLGINNEERGNVSQSGNGTYFQDSLVRITATANNGYRFVNWMKDGEVFGTKADTTFKATENLLLVAHFEAIPFTISVSSNNDEWGSVSQSGNGTYFIDSLVSITATANEGYHFVSWMMGSEVFGTKADTTFKATEDLVLVANFELITFTISISSHNEAWGGVSQSGNGTYFQDSLVRITATANEGYRFVNWMNGGEVFGTKADTAFMATEDFVLVAYFEAIPFTIQITSNNDAWGSVSQNGNGTYSIGYWLSITATANEGYRFVNWTKKDGAEFNKEAVHTFTVTENLELTANFEKLPDDVANENRQDDNFSLYVQDRTICLSENVGAVQVYNVAGQCVYSGVSTAIPVRHSGVYIVKVGTRSYKVVVR